MASPNRVSEVAALFSPPLGCSNRASQATFSPDLFPRSPVLANSPYRLPPIPKSMAGNDLVSGIVDKFNSLTVTDARDEEKARYERQLAKLKAALERANMAREEAEEEAQRLREKMRDMQDDRIMERDSLRERCTEYEKKYEKAKDRFKLQRSKNEEAMQKAHSEYLEKEKEHWRDIASVQELAEWEKRLRIEASKLVEFMQLERRFDAQVARSRRTTGATNGCKASRSDVSRVHTTVDSRPDGLPIMRHDSTQESKYTEMAVEEVTTVSSHHISRTQREQIVLPQQSAEHQPRRRRSQQQHQHYGQVHNQAPLEQPITEREVHDSLREVTPEGPPPMPIRPYRKAPALQASRSIPVIFGDDDDGDAVENNDYHDADSEDKENKQPPIPVTPARGGGGLGPMYHHHHNDKSTLASHHSTPGGRGEVRSGMLDVLKTPMTMDRAAALAAIEYRRRGRARSFVAGHLTPKAVDVADKRDVSAPALACTMTVGRRW